MVNSHQEKKDEKKKKEVQSFVTDKWNTLS